MAVLEEGRLLVARESRLVYTVRKVLPNGNVVLECDDDGSLQDDDDPDGDGSPDQLLETFEVWRPGMVIRDRTGKGVFCREATGWRCFFGVPPADIEKRVLANQPAGLPPTLSTRGIERSKRG
jgi:hypothetical protein